jgi:hypothetical protein
MNAVMVVIVPKLAELPLQTSRVPEQNMIEKLPPYSAYQPLNEGMRHRNFGDGLDFVNFKDTQVCLPSVILE